MPSLTVLTIHELIVHQGSTGAGLRTTIQAESVQLFSLQCSLNDRFHTSLNEPKQNTKHLSWF